MSLERRRQPNHQGKGYASASQLQFFFLILFSGKDQSMNKFLWFFFLLSTKNCIFFFLKTQKEVSVYHSLTQERRKNKEGGGGGGHVTYSLTLIRPKCIFLFFMRIETKVSLSSIMVIGKLVTIF